MQARTTAGRTTAARRMLARATVGWRMTARTTAGWTTAARRMLARTTAGGATVIRPEQVRVTAGSVTADPMAMAPRTRVVRHLPVTGPAAAPMTLGTKTCPGTCTLTTEEPTSV